MIQYPPSAPPGIPIAAHKLDGRGRPLHHGGPHAHGFYALLFGIGGKGVMRVGNTDLEIEPGSFVVTAPGEVHDTTRLHGVARWGLDFTPDAYGYEAAGWLFPLPNRPEWMALLRHSWQPPRVIQIPAAQQASWVRQFETIHHELVERGPGFREVVLAELKSLLIRTGRFASHDPVPISPLIGEVFNVIASRFAEQLRLAHVARAVGRSPAYLTTLVREQTGMTVQEWIIERRMAEARRHLVETDENIDTLAERVGYNDTTLFIRHFKRAHGVTPRKWRTAV